MTGAPERHHPRCCCSSQLARRDIWLQRKNRSQAGHGGHGRTCCRLDPVAIDPKRTRQMIRLADGVVFDYVVPIFNMVTSTAKDSNGA